MNVPGNQNIACRNQHQNMNTIVSTQQAPSTQSPSFSLEQLQNQVTQMNQMTALMLFKQNCFSYEDCMGYFLLFLLVHLVYGSLILVQPIICVLVSV